ncbi:amastin-like surface protein, putative [Leishmania donovani]|uniref:Amastin-like surface protein, putative n=1 Tax=Leishmania donovani TaxID=5661 RepID=A0A3Q8IUK8_LEIDO|nr:amastin-like surface protein, putative [Leishmania donovani]
MAPSVPLILYVVLQFVAFLLLLVGMPIEVFRLRVAGGSTVCITLWGQKLSCTSVGYLFFQEVVWRSCRKRVARFRAAQAFVIISIFVSLAAFIAGVTFLYGISLLRWVCLVLNVVGMVTSCVVWAAMAVTYNKTDDRVCLPVKTLGRYGAGFVLFVLAWILDIINIILLLLPCTTTDAAQDKTEQPPTAQE